MKRNLMVLLLSIILLISLVHAVDIEYSIKQGNSYDLKRPCFNNGTYCDSGTTCNLTVINVNGDASPIVNDENMTRHSSYYNYTLSTAQTSINGNYFASVTCTDSGNSAFDTFYYSVNPSGQSGNENIYFFIFVILLIYTITFFGFFGKNIPITVLGGMAMMFLSIYIINNGIIIFRDTLTIYIAYLTLSIGVIMAFWALLEQFEVI